MDDRILNKIKAVIGCDIDERFIDLVIKRLESFGYTVQEADTWAIAFSIQKVENNIKNSCNTTVIPLGLESTAVDMVCGEILFVKKQSGTLEDFDLEMMVKQVQAGDTNITFAVEKSVSVEQRLDTLFSYLINGGKDEFACYRKIKW